MMQSRVVDSLFDALKIEPERCEMLHDGRGASSH